MIPNARGLVILTMVGIALLYLAATAITRGMDANGNDAVSKRTFSNLPQHYREGREGYSVHPKTIHPFNDYIRGSKRYADI